MFSIKLSVAQGAENGVLFFFFFPYSLIVGFSLPLLCLSKRLYLGSLRYKLLTSKREPYYVNQAFKKMLFKNLFFQLCDLKKIYHFTNVALPF